MRGSTSMWRARRWNRRASRAGLPASHPKVFGLGTTRWLCVHCPVAGGVCRVLMDGRRWWTAWPSARRVRYAYGAQAMLEGRYTVDWDGAPRLPIYTPGTSVLMTPLVAIGGVGAATHLGRPVWTAYRATGGGGCAASGAAGRCAACGRARAGNPCHAYDGVAGHERSADGGAADARGGSADARVDPCCRRRGSYRWLSRLDAASRGLLAAGLTALSAFPRWRKSTAAYMLGAAPLLAGLAAWQWTTLGSPLLTGYQSVLASPDHSARSARCFRQRISFCHPVHRWTVGERTDDRSAPPERTCVCARADKRRWLPDSAWRRSAGTARLDRAGASTRCSGSDRTVWAGRSVAAQRVQHLLLSVAQVHAADRPIPGHRCELGPDTYRRGLACRCWPVGEHLVSQLEAPNASLQHPR